MFTEMKINQKFAKKAMVVASLTAGVIGFNSMFNEAQATSSQKSTPSDCYKYVGGVKTWASSSNNCGDGGSGCTNGSC
jgi:hypothetical protein